MLPSLHIWSRTEQSWNKKIESHSKAKWFAGNASIRYGTLNEQIARDMYELEFKCIIQELGFVVISTVPWLGFSQDGVAVVHEKPSHLIEIKCVIAGEKFEIPEL